MHTACQTPQTPRKPNDKLILTVWTLDPYLGGEYSPTRCPQLRRITHAQNAGNDPPSEDLIQGLFKNPDGRRSGTDSSMKKRHSTEQIVPNQCLANADLGKGKIGG